MADQGPALDPSGAGFEQLVADVTRRLNTHGIEPGQLGDYAVVLQRDGEDVARRTFPRVAQHLARGCSDCEADLVDLREHAATDLIATADHGRERFGDGSAWAGLTRVIAQLVPVSAAPQFAVRGPAADTRIYELAGMLIALETRRQSAPDAPVFELGGSVTAPDRSTFDLDGRPLRLLSASGEPVAVARLDDLASFRMNGIPAGTYALELLLDDRVVRVEPIRVGE